MKVLLSVFTILLFTGVSAADPVDIPITVLDTWEITYASDIQDISYNWNTDQIAIRSNGDGKIYLADPDDLSLQDEFDLPPDMEGFGLNVVFEPVQLNRLSITPTMETTGPHSPIRREQMEADWISTTSREMENCFREQAYHPTASTVCTRTLLTT